MERAADILGAAMRRLERPEATMAWLAGAWAAIVGEQLAAHTKPIGVNGGILEVRASGADWQNQLECMSSEFREKINRAWGGGLVQELRFTAARATGSLSKEADNQHTPFVRTRASQDKRR